MLLPFALSLLPLCCCLAMIRVRAPSRLHFGLLHLAPSADTAPRPSRLQVPERLFGGVGLMIETPGVQVALSPAKAWAAEGALAGRALDSAERVRQALPAVTLAPQRLVVEKAAPEHAGLGTGTQLGLAVARGLTEIAGLGPVDGLELARLVGRGRRSALGIHGFAQGGFLVEAGKKQGEGIAPLVARQTFPESWRVLLILAPCEPGLHGRQEEQAFRQLEEHPVPQTTTDLLCRLVLLGMLPALAEQDWPAFGEALYEFNVLVGETFASVQGGIYANPIIGDLVRWLREQGIRGAGQSSWGPAVFAIARDEGQAQNLAGRVRSRFPLTADAVIVSRACNMGATVMRLG